ncbi:MAG TPA: DNA gyrase subunit A [Candidatus Avidehalobacter gallistercoris]|uniref:DNA gyrase subunit A n=1 Tax=Candidatus Avidehalobacter gallistercoris TaxID=2840694 RepID=A0A9D1HKQ4_9FIRM|nr:DNA gyrase subunit A [Candidatus Avidehalobacter gallistercoris]
MSEIYNSGNIKRSEISHEMRSAYLRYSMSVIIGRALPDVRDGLKPVHRRILYAMYEQGVTPDKPYKKSARSVGDIMGKYHPHGDSAIYDSLVRMAQDFSMRYPLIDGHGNFGSIDGDSAAAMRYTEARLQRFALEMMRDIDKDTVDFMPNYDGEEQEPTVLPAVVPNLLVNGSSGIAVGMATNIPTHNLTEVCDGICALIENPEIEIDELMHYIKGPDFPTAGLILGTDGIKDAYRTGRGAIKMRAKTHIEVTARGKQRIVVTELPYQVNKARLIEKIAQLVRDKQIEGITELRDETSRDGVRVVIELKSDAVAQVILNRLYKHTQMQDTFGAIMIALVDGEPKLLNLKQILECYINHQKQVITRRSRFELAKAQERAHILEGLKIAIDYIDEVVATIRNAANPDEARTKLMERFGLSYKQATAILEMRLRALTGLEHGKIDAEYAELIKTIAYLEQVLSSERMVLGIIKEQLITLKNKFGDDRRTTIVGDEGEMSDEDLIAEEDMVITISHAGYIKRLNLNTYRQQRRGGRGVTGMTTRDEDFVEQMFIASTHDYLLIFTSRGRCFRLKVHEIPEVSRTARGSALVNLLALEGGEKLRTVIPIKSFDQGGYLVMATRAGIVKKTALDQYNSRNNGIIALTMDDNDDLIAAMLTDGNSDLMLSTAAGLVIRFSETGVRPMGRVARGMKGITLNEGDELVAMTKAEDMSYLMVVSEKGFGKRTPLSLENYRRITRGGKGVHTMRCNEKTGRLVAAMNVKDGDELMLITKGGIIIRINTSDVSEQGRMTQGVTLINLDEDDQVMDVARVMTKEEEPASARNTAQQVPDDSVAPAQLGLKQEIDDTAEEARQISLLLERAEADTKDQNN